VTKQSWWRPALALIAFGDFGVISEQVKLGLFAAAIVLALAGWKLAGITGLPSPTTRVPHAVAMLFATFDEMFTGRILRREPRATREAVRMGRKKMWASSTKAERELSWRIVPVEDALRRAAEWFVARGYAPAPPKLIRAVAGVPA